MQAKKWQMLVAEGAGVVLEPGRGDGGTLFVQSATVPAPSGSGGTPFGAARGPRPWATDAPPSVPQVVLAAEHYNRLVRMIKKGSVVTLQIGVQTKFHDEDLMGQNVIAEIAGTDLKHEIVMIGGHFDAWHSGTGATDNAAGSAVCMEAMRILRAVAAKPRRTIRIGLWSGEEQGLLGSRAYVAEHFGKRVDTPSTGPRPRATEEAGTGSASQTQVSSSGGSSEPQRPQRAPGKYELKPNHANFAAYFNLDNGTGKIRGIHMQGNEACRPIFRSWLAPFKDLGASTVSLTNTGGTDHLSFDGVGLPGFQFIQDPIEYETRTHHSNMDVYERVQEDDMKQAAIIMAAFAYQAATRDEKLPRKPLVGEILTAGN
jgi:Zn-dependent M28 family amino/carboxypeptidase